MKLSADGKLAAIGTEKSNIYLFNCFEKQIIFKFNQAHQGIYFPRTNRSLTLQ